MRLNCTGGRNCSKARRMSFFLMSMWAPPPDFQVSSDAASSLGYRAIFENQCFFGTWSISQQPLSIVYEELFPAPLLWPLICGDLSGRHNEVEFICNNESAVTVLSSGTSRDLNLMVLLHYLALLAVYHSFSLTATSV